MAVGGTGGRGGLCGAGLPGGVGEAGEETFCLLCAPFCAGELVAEEVGVAEGIGEETSERGGRLAVVDGGLNVGRAVRHGS